MANLGGTTRRMISGYQPGRRSQPGRRVRRGRSSSAALIAAAALAVLDLGLLRRRLMRWGATDAELEMALAGDDLLPAVNLTSTRSITIGVAVEQVWPWLVQLGQGRGGFYSYDFLENMFGLNIHSADRIHPQWQLLAVGSPVRLAEQVALTVAVLEPGRALVLRGDVSLGTAAVPYDFTWAFTLHHAPMGTSRLVVRERYCYVRRWAGLVVQPAELVSCLMSPRMLRGIKCRAEHHGATIVDAQLMDKEICA